MKKVLLTALILLPFASAVNAKGSKTACTMTDVDGAWDTSSSSYNFTFPSVGTSNDTDIISSCSITATSATAGTLDCGDFSGAATLKGKKISWTLDSDSQTGYEDSIKTLAISVATENGSVIDAGTVDVTINNVKYGSKPTIKSKKGTCSLSGGVALTLKGTIAANVDDKDITKNFTYRTTLKLAKP